MAVLIDTSVLIALERGLGGLDDLPLDEERAISVITVSELLHGVHRAAGRQRAQRHAAVERILATIEPVPITSLVARVHAEVWARLAAAGATVGTHDLWIAATALAHGLGVVTRNVRDFERVPGLRVIAA